MCEIKSLSVLGLFLAAFVLLAFLTDLSESAPKKAPAKADKIIQEWMNISEYWCFPDNLPESILDDVYECFRKSRGNKVRLTRL